MAFSQTKHAERSEKRRGGADRYPASSRREVQPPLSSPRTWNQRKEKETKGKESEEHSMGPRGKVLLSSLC